MAQYLREQRIVRIVLAVMAALLVALAVVTVLALSGRLGVPVDEPTPTVEVGEQLPETPPSPTPLPPCEADQVADSLEAVLAALRENDMEAANARLELALSGYAAVMDQANCQSLAHDLVEVQALIAAARAWSLAQETNSVRRLEEAGLLAELALRLARVGPAGELAQSLAEAIEQKRAVMADALAPDREVTHPLTLDAEQVGGLHPLCEINTLIKPLLIDQSGDPAPRVNRIEVTSDTLYLIAEGQLMVADLERVHGASPAVFLQPASEEGEPVAGAVVSELIDMTLDSNGALLLLEKSGRVLRRTRDGVWSLARQAQPEELPVAVAPYDTRFYLLDPQVNQIWRYAPGEVGYDEAYFYPGIVRNLTPGVDMAIDGAIYVGRRDGVVRRYFVGVEDPDFRPDTGLGTPTAVFLPDEQDSVLVYVVDGPGRRLLGLDRESGSYRLGFTVNLREIEPLTAGAIRGGRLYLTDGRQLLISILTPTPTPAVDCPAFPFAPTVAFDSPALVGLDPQLPVPVALPLAPARYPGGRVPDLGYGVLEGFAFPGVAYSETIRAIAAGTITQILSGTAPLQVSDLDVITSTGRIPAEAFDAIWGTQIWIDHAQGIESRYGGFAALLPGIEPGQEVRRLTILGFAGEGPVYLGIWVDGQYLGYGLSLQETMAGFDALFSEE